MTIVFPSVAVRPREKKSELAAERPGHTELPGGQATVKK